MSDIHDASACWRLKLERKRLGLSQDAFAEAGGIRRTALYLYERGDRMPTLEFLLNCTSIGLDFSHVIFGECNLRNNSEIQLSESELIRIFALVDVYARDSRSRLLAHEYQQQLLSQLCRIASDRSEEDIDWSDLEEEARKFAG